MHMRNGKGSFWEINSFHAIRYMSVGYNRYNSANPVTCECIICYRRQTVLHTTLAMIAQFDNSLATSCSDWREIENIDSTVVRCDCDAAVWKMLVIFRWNKFFVSKCDSSNFLTRHRVFRCRVHVVLSTKRRSIFIHFLLNLCCILNRFNSNITQFPALLLCVYHC